LGLETLDVATIHEKTVASMASPAASKAGSNAFRRAHLFFAEAIAPIEQTHAAARESDLHIGQLSQTLTQRTAESSSTNQRLKRSIRRRLEAEDALKKSSRQHTRLVAQAHRLQLHLRHLTRRFLSTHEDKRRKMSRQLHDEIAQTLLGLNVRILALKNAARADTENLKKEIASTQRLVKESITIINRAADEYGIPHET